MTKYARITVGRFKNYYGLILRYDGDYAVISIGGVEFSYAKGEYVEIENVPNR